MTWDKAAIHKLLDENPRAVERALVVIYRRQTSDEQVSFQTTHANSRGFGAYDAEFCTDVAQKLISGRIHTLSPKQLAVVRNKMKRYHRQLCEEANANQAAIESMAQPAPQIDQMCGCELSDGEPMLCLGQGRCQMPDKMQVWG